MFSLETHHILLVFLFSVFQGLIRTCSHVPVVDTENEGDVTQEDFQTRNTTILTFDLYQPSGRYGCPVFKLYCLYNRLKVCTKKLIFLFLNENIYCWYSKEPFQ